MSTTKAKLLLLLALIILFFGFVSLNFTPVFANTQENIQIKFTYQENDWTYDTSDFQSNNFHFQSQGQKFGRWGTPTQRATLLKNVYNLGFTAEQTLEYGFVGIKHLIDNIKKCINKPSKDATLKFTPNKSNKFEFTQEEIGYQLDFKPILFQIIKKLTASEQNLTINLQPIKLLPKVYLKDLKEYNNLKSSFYTSFNGETSNRVHNIKTATQKFNGLILENGKEYSFNEITGRRNEQNGYLPAKIIVDKQYVDGFGGGVCQVSSTLYNALLLSGVEITELHSHSLTSSYINKGFDAMVNYGTSDLRWKNNTGDTLYINGYVIDNQVHFKIYGKPSKPYLTYKRVTEIEKEIEPKADEVIIDTKGEYTDLVVFEDEFAYINYPKKGYKVRAILEIYDGEKLIERKLLRRVTYQASTGIKVVGSKPRPAKTTQEPQGTLNKQTYYFWQNFF